MCPLERGPVVRGGARNGVAAALSMQLKFKSRLSKSHIDKFKETSEHMGSNPGEVAADL